MNIIPINMGKAEKIASLISTNPLKADWKDKNWWKLQNIGKLRQVIKSWNYDEDNTMMFNNFIES